MARHSTSVLITGETGAGKELVAEAVHKLSPRADKPFITVNCAAIPEALIEAELFGHTRGAFTGAVQSRLGKIHAAQGGTIFFDEIGELPLASQAKLLRFLESGEVQRLGTSDVFRLDARVVAATNVDLEKRVQQGTFREDLFYRLSVFPIEVAAAAQAAGADVPLLARHFVGRLTGNMEVVSIRRREAKLAGHSWPGNVRELRNVIERAFVLADGRSIDHSRTDTSSQTIAARSALHQKPLNIPLHRLAALVQIYMDSLGNSASSEVTTMRDWQVIPEIVGSNAILRMAAMQAIDAVEQGRHFVVEGEAGSGRRLLARSAWCRRSPGARSLFTLDCRMFQRWRRGASLWRAFLGQLAAPHSIVENQFLPWAADCCSCTRISFAQDPEPAGAVPRQASFPAARRGDPASDDLHSTSMRPLRASSRSCRTYCCGCASRPCASESRTFARSRSIPSQRFSRSKGFLLPGADRQLLDL